MTSQAAVKAAILDLVDADVATSGTASVFHGVQVEYGHPGEQGRRENVWLGHTVLGEDRPPAMGGPTVSGGTNRRRRNREDYTLHVWVEVFRPPARRIGRVAEARATEIATAVQNLVRDNHRLQVDGVDTLNSGGWARPDGVEMDTDQPGEDVRTLVDIRIRVSDDTD